MCWCVVCWCVVCRCGVLVCSVLLCSVLVCSVLLQNVGMLRCSRADSLFLTQMHGCANNCQVSL